jgi:hypothetical protein
VNRYLHENILTACQMRGPGLHTQTPGSVADNPLQRHNSGKAKGAILTEALAAIFGYL